jgi:integrase
MRKISVRYLVAKQQKSRTLFYWQPNRVLREAGFLPRRLAGRTNDLADAIREADALNRELDAWRGGYQPAPIQPGTLLWLIRLYRADPRYTDLASSSQRSYDNRLAVIEAWSERAGHPPIRTIERRHCKAFYRSLSGTPGMANAVMRMLRVLLAFAIDEGELSSNPAEKMRLRGRPPRDQVWTPEQIAAFVDAAAQQGRPSLGFAVRLAAALGQREGDILRLGWSQYDGSAVRLRQRKTGKLLAVPAVADLREALDGMPRTAATMVANEMTGRPYGEDVFRHLFREVAALAGLPNDLQFRDLRRTAAVRLAEAGCSVPEIAAITGHELSRTVQILEVYCPRNTVMAQNAITKLEEYRAARRTDGERKLEG